MKAILIMDGDTEPKTVDLAADGRSFEFMGSTYRIVEPVVLPLPADGVPVSFGLGEWAPDGEGRLYPLYSETEIAEQLRAIMDRRVEAPNG